jgi:hypothetical protein
MDSVDHFQRAVKLAEAPHFIPGTKHDIGKSRPGLIPGRVLLAIGEVLAFGVKKYGVDNWKLVPDSRRRYLDALMRHMAAWSDGERLDQESGLPHLAHACTCVVFLLYFELTGEWP